jgi:Zn-dependent M28 family amino/carboxypeptidase
METDGGAGHPLGINYATKPEARWMFDAVAKILQSSGAGILNLAEHPGADIGPLTKLGVPGFSPIQDNRTYFNYHHTAADTLDKIVPQELAENAAVVAVTAYALANLEKPLPR